MKKIVEELAGKDFEESFGKIYAAKHIYTSCTDVTQHEVSTELVRLFSVCKETIIDAYGIGEAQKLLSSVKKDDVFILISRSGENEKILELAR